MKLYIGRNALIALAALLPFGAAVPSAEAEDGRQHTIGIWSTGHISPLPSGLMQYDNQTLREIVHTSAGGDRLRIRIANTFGSTTLHIGAVHVAAAASVAQIVGGTDHAVTFSGRDSVDVPSGSVALSDAIDFPQTGSADLAISIYLPGPTAGKTTTFFQGTTYVAASGGNWVDATDLPGATSLGEWPFLFGVDVPSGEDGATVVAFADSATILSQWPKALAERLAARRLGHVGVVNVAIAGNRLLNNSAGPFGPDPRWGQSLLTRFERDVLGQPGARQVIVWIGLNDIAGPGVFYPSSEVVTQGDLIAGLRQLIARAHEQGLSIWACTISPMGGNTSLPGFDTSAHEAARVALNQWIRASGEFDGVVDADNAIRDPSNPTRLLPLYDSGDHLHPSTEGGRAIARAIDLDRLLEP
jgi:lysophospholipase L1-like esterase